MFVVFVSHLGKPMDVEVGPISWALGITAYEARLALATSPPCIVQTSATRDRAEGFVTMLRSRGHGAHLFDDALFVPSVRMTPLDDFVFEADGVTRADSRETLGYGDVFAILLAVHDTSDETEHAFDPGTTNPRNQPRNVTKRIEREHVAYFFRRSGERPWILRERHTRYTGLGAERAPVAFTNFQRTVERLRVATTNAVVDDRLLRRRVAERRSNDFSLSASLRTSQAGMDLLAHLLALTIANQGGSPYR